MAGKMGEQQLGRILQKIAENENSIQGLHREMIIFVEETENSRGQGQNNIQIWEQTEEKFKGVWARLMEIGEELQQICHEFMNVREETLNRGAEMVNLHEGMTDMQSPTLKLHQDLRPLKK